MVVQDARWDELELQQPALGDHRVARVVPALIADDEIHPIGEVVDRLALALVPPLGPEHDRGRHVGLSVWEPRRLAPTLARETRSLSIAPVTDDATSTPTTDEQLAHLSPEERDVLAKVTEIVRRIQFGTVVLVIQDGKVVQIEMAEKFRLR